MKSAYQLILQFRGDSIEAYDAMIALEDDLIAELQGMAKVDGHDVGSGEANIFILSSNPSGRFSGRGTCWSAGSACKP